MPKVLSAEEIICFRNRMCDRALEAFSAHGVEGISLRSLATELGCSRTTPYRYFKNKADILAALREREFGRLADVLEASQTEVEDTGERFTALARSYIRFALENPNAYRVMYEVKDQSSEDYPSLVAEIMRSSNPMRQLVKTAVADGCMQGDPKNISYTIWASLHGLISLHLFDLLGQERSFEELASVMLSSIRQAVGLELTGRPAAARTAP